MFQKSVGILRLKKLTLKIESAEKRAVWEGREREGGVLVTGLNAVSQVSKYKYVSFNNAAAS